MLDFRMWVILYCGHASPRVNSVQAGLAPCMLQAHGSLKCSTKLNQELDWPYCKAATQMASVRMSDPDRSPWDRLQWFRKLETFGENNAAVLASGPGGETNALW